MKKKVFFLFLYCLSVFAEPTTQKQAQNVVANWLKIDSKPMNMKLGTNIKDVDTIYDSKNKPLYHIVNLKPNGYVIVSGEDLVEPIIAFVENGQFINSTDNPLGALVMGDVPGRVKHARDIEAKKIKTNKTYQKYSYMSDAKQKWQTLQKEDNIASTVEEGTTSISDIRVEPLLPTQWGQSTEDGGDLCYNLYTPNNYVSGCVATALAQTMRYYEYPTSTIGTDSYEYFIDGSTNNGNLMGGDGMGGAYNWAIMDYGPDINDSTHRHMIGRLMHDTGLSVNMNYSSSGSGANTLDTADALTDTFGYENAKKAYNSGNNLDSTIRNTILNSNLDAGYPVILGITGNSGGHAIVAEGYGYDNSTLYHHLNMGWSGSNDAWYNLPNIDTNYYTFNSVYKAIYNIYPSGTGEIISGRITDSNANPIVGAIITASYDTFTKQATSNAKGIYALEKIPSNTTFTISVSKSGYSFADQQVETGTSSNYGSVGNKSGIDFVDGSFSAPSSISASDGSYVDKVVINWSFVSGATSYKLFRATSSSGTKTEIYSGSSLSYDDTSVSAGIIYYYYAQACNSESCSGYSTFDTGNTAVVADISLSEAIDNMSLSISLGGDANWFGQNEIYTYDEDSVQSGDISDNQSTNFQIEVTDAGTLTFEWKVSSESNFDYLKFYIDDVEQDKISGTVDWVTQTYVISEGEHTLKWSYEKDVSVSDDSDAGWVDHIVWTGSSTSTETNITPIIMYLLN